MVGASACRKSLTSLRDKEYKASTEWVCIIYPQLRFRRGDGAQEGCFRSCTLYSWLIFVGSHVQRAQCLGADSLSGDYRGQSSRPERSGCSRSESESGRPSVKQCPGGSYRCD